MVENKTKSEESENQNEFIKIRKTMGSIEIGIVNIIHRDHADSKKKSTKMESS